ncbi:MAG: translocation/assembly module TamB domain-containing protein [Gammaproteobacteria bacterium]
MQGANLPSGDWRLQGRGNRQAIESLRLEGDILKGQVRANAKLSLPPNLAWQAELSGADLDPAAQWRDLSGKIAVKLSSQGKLDQGALQASIKLEQLSGTLSGQAIQGQGEVALANREISIDKLRISAGKAYLQANGKLDGVWALTWQLEVPNLKGLLPNARGSLNGSGSLAGSRNQPRADLKLAASQFAIGATAIAKLQADANVDVSGETTSRIRVDGSDLRIGGQDWNSMSIQAAGTPRQHTATAALGGALGKIDLALSGALESDNTWRGRLNRFSARATQAGDWVLEKPMALTVSAREARAENACIASKPSQICAQGQWRAGQGGSAKLALTQLDTARFRQWLPAQFSLANSVNGQASGTLAPDGTVQGALDAKISPGKVRFSNQGLPAEIDLRAGNLHAEASGRDLRADFKLDLGNIGQLAGSAQIKDFLKEPLINGNLKADIGDLKWVSMFAPQAQGVAGHLRADLDISGSPAALSLSGNADLSGGAAEIPRLGMQLKAIQLRATGAGKGILRFDGSARSGNGALTLTGQWDPTRNQLDLALRGKDFQAANTAQLQAVIGTDLHLSLAQGKARLEGEVDVPKAFIKPAGGAAGGRVEPSSDVVIVDGASGKTAKATALAIDAKVRISLGEDVRIETRGFKGKLRGAVLVEQTPRLAPRGNGQVEVVAGDYKIYGQFLTIERGRLLFSGGPIDNPGLDLRVSRKFNDVTAGAQVRGSLKNPQLQLFSQPAMADTSVLSYLVLGRAPSALSGSENALLLQAASALGGGDRLSEGVANALGLDDLAVNTGAGGADASVAFGKYLSPDLYVSYGIGLFDAVNTFKLRYRFGKHLNFEAASSGKQSSADVLYSIER